ncbi:WSC domain-containing protein [Xylariomycetidae sp. FL0641]|nr:WSC domain-containing protein [Xylariomycetidae sp. FL0641]
MRASVAPPPFRGVVAVLGLLLSLLPLPVGADSNNNTTTTLTIVRDSTVYAYAGCYNETSALAHTTGARALDGGLFLAAPGALTVPRCLAFCARGTPTVYAFAGLEYSRECWCALTLSSLSARLPDAACDTPCDGDAATACGGALRLSLYNLTDQGRENHGKESGAAAAARAGRRGAYYAVLGAVVGVLVLGAMVG